jgi:serine/threonine protein phosphatase PrpC
MNDPPTGQPPTTDATTAEPAVVAPAGASGGVASGIAGGEVRLQLFGRTDVGQIREHNEDNFLVADLTRKSRSMLEADRAFAIGPGGTILGVCDGMGGAAAGEVASQLAVDIIFEKMSAAGAPRNRDEFACRLVQAVEAAGLRIFTEAKVDRARRGMGTTATIAGLIDDHLFFAQVGDSRGYVLRGDKLVQVTRDQSLVNQLIEAGQLTEAEAETFEHNNIILQALGTADTVQVDLTYVVLRQGDTLMLCSDGLSGMVRFDEIRDVLMSTPDPLEACRILTERANQAGGHDTITVIVSKFDGQALNASPDLDDLKYKKYSLPEDPFTQGIESLPRQTVREPSDRPAVVINAAGPSSVQVGERLSDHGPSRSKVTHTLVGAQMSQAALAAIAARAPEPPPPHGGPAGWRDRPKARAEDSEPIFIPTSNAPAWMVGGVVLTALALALVAGYYLLR